ncbi:carbohydrate-binding protein [Wenyingzhuangia sp. IMCC45467]
MKKKLSIYVVLMLFTVVAYSQTSERFEAENFDEASGAKAESNGSLSGGGNVGYIQNNTWIKFSNFEFGQYDERIDIIASSDTNGGNVELRLDATDGTLIGTATVVGTGDWSNYQSVSATITQTTGTHDLYLVFTGGGGYLFNVDYFEKITNNPNATTYSLTTGVNDEQYGTVSSNVSGTEFAENTSITLTANDNFGYDFVQWVNGSGTPLTTDNPVTFSISSDTTFVAQFQQVNTYELTVNTSGASGFGDYEISPAGKDGAYSFYEAGTEVTITAIENDIIQFDNWSTGETSLATTVTMNQNSTITGTYSHDSFIAGWTFKEDKYAHPRIAELFSDVSNKPELYAYNIADDEITANVRTNERAGKTGFSVWNTNRGDFFYFMTSFSTVGYENIVITSELLAYYYGCDEWTFQYSLDGTNFTDLSSVTTINGSSYTSIGGTLPAQAEGQSTVYIRWYPNTSGPKHGDVADVTATMLANISVKADEVSLNTKAFELSANITAFPNPTNDLLYLSLPNTSGKLSYQVFNVVGNKVLSGSLSIKNKQAVLSLRSLVTGIYIVTAKDASENFYSFKVIKK